MGEDFGWGSIKFDMPHHIPTNHLLHAEIQPADTREQGTNLRATHDPTT
jgi:hypothetical protein